MLLDGFCNGKSHTKIDGNWGYPHDSGNIHLAHDVGK